MECQLSTTAASVLHNAIAKQEVNRDQWLDELNRWDSQNTSPLPPRSEKGRMSPTLGFPRSQTSFPSPGLGSIFSSHGGSRHQKSDAWPRTSKISEDRPPCPFGIGLWDEIIAEGNKDVAWLRPETDMALLNGATPTLQPRMRSTVYDRNFAPSSSKRGETRAPLPSVQAGYTSKLFPDSKLFPNSSKASSPIAKKLGPKHVFSMCNPSDEYCRDRRDHHMTENANAVPWDGVWNRRKRNPKQAAMQARWEQIPNVTVSAADDGWMKSTRADSPEKTAASATAEEEERERY
ncbi:hypothetical protein M8818_000635 [Zalaria obscura]|uniref:Uncharacterized protein n=1 Tax=Zalaria obscura TaxID=2024903 RepID=A0ACC3SMZ8_9PEZI